MHLSTKQDEQPDETTNQKEGGHVSFHKKGNCKDEGTDCISSQPKQCKRFMKHGHKRIRGCNKGEKCKKFHPALCEESLNTGKCSIEKCTLVHVKQTKRGSSSKDRSESAKFKKER